MDTLSDRWLLVARRGLGPRALALTLIAALAADGLPQEVLYRFDGTGIDGLGSAVAAYPDLDGDGVNEILMSAPGGQVQKGEVTAISGATGSPLFSIVGPAWEGEGASDGFGYGLATAGDVDGDGVEDVLVGAPLDNDPGQLISNNGVLFVYSGADQSLLHHIVGQQDQGVLGISVAALGDLDGDGFDDFAAGASGERNGAGLYTGVVHVFSGASGSELYTLEGAISNEYFGRALADLLDLDGDGARDLVVGTYSLSGPGRIEVFSGASGTSLYGVSGFVNGDEFGASVGSVADLDGDGLVEILAGATQRLVGGHGYALLLSGATGTPLSMFSGSAAYDQLGVRVGGAGDVNGDGFEDLLIGASQWDVGSTLVGYARLYSGATRELLYDFSGRRVEDAFGAALAGLGDLDGDGLAEVAIAAPSSTSDPTLREGWVEIYRGNDLHLHLSDHVVTDGDALLLSTREGGIFQPAVLAVVDVNGLPISQVVAASRLDGSGGWSLVATVPPGLAGLFLKLRSYTLDGLGSLLVSADEELEIR